MNKTLRIGLAVLLSVVCIGSIGVIVHRNQDYQIGAEVYAEAETLAGLPDWEELPQSPSDGQVPTAEPEPPSDAPVSEPAEEVPDAEPSVPAAKDPYAEALQAMDFSALRAVNPEVQGWILIPGTAISYPVVQGTDNQYYLTHTWKKTASAVGAIFLEARNRADLTDENTVIYGHRMNNGSMFATLKYYRTKQFWQQHPKVYLTDDSGTHSYEIFAAYEVSTSGSAYQIGFSGTESKQRFLDDCLSQAVYDTGIVPAVQDRILTLSTCTGNGHAARWVVQARLPMAAPAEAETEEVPAASEAAEPVLPDVQQPLEESAEASAPETLPAESDAEPLDGVEEINETP